MEKTKNLGLNKQEQDEIYDVQIINDNMDIIDEKVQECFQSVSDGKALMASGITDKGVPTDADATFQEMYDNVMAIQTNTTLQSKNASLSTSEQVITADTGYDGLSKVIVPAVTGNASDGDVVAGKEFSSALGINQVGTLVDKTGVTEYTATASLDSTNSELEMKIPATGKYNTSNKLKATFATIASLIGLTASKLVKGNTILGITGNSNNMDTSSADATAGDVLSGKKVGVKGSLITGSMTNRKGTTVDATAVSSDDNYTYFTTPAGCYSAASKVRTPNSNLGGKNIVSSYCEAPIGDGASTATISIDNIPSDDCVIVFAHPEDTRSTTALTLPSGATILLSNVTPAVRSFARVRYYVVKVTGKSGNTINFNFSATGSGNNNLYIRYVVINKQLTKAVTATGLTKDSFYVVIRNVDYRVTYHNIFTGAVIQYYDMPYTSTYFWGYHMANITVLKAMEESAITTRTYSSDGSSGNYSQVFIELK